MIQTYFLDFPAEPFSIYKDGSSAGVMLGLNAVDESSLSDAAVKLSIRTVIGQFHLYKSIFHPLKNMSFKTKYSRKTESIRIAAAKVEFEFQSFYIRILKNFIRILKYTSIWALI